MSQITRSERNAGKPSVPVVEQRRRILTALAAYPREPGMERDWSMSTMAYIAFPDFKFRSAQGAALCISRTVRGLVDDKLLRYGKYHYQITFLGRDEAAKL